MKLLLAIGSVLLSAQVYAGSLTIQELGTTTETGDFPVCSNGAGKLLPCYDPNPIPPPDDPYSGGWTGTMIYDRSLDPSNCIDANITMRAYSTSVRDIVVRIAGEAPKLLNTRFNIPSDGYASFISNTDPYEPLYGCFLNRTDTFCPFGYKTDFILQFTLNGYASGEWVEQNNYCYGTWSFTKD